MCDVDDYYADQIKALDSLPLLHQSCKVIMESTGKQPEGPPLPWWKMFTDKEPKWWYPNETSK